MADKKAVRIQNSILNGAEKKALAWLAERQPKWVVSDMLTLVGIIGALMIGAGFQEHQLALAEHRWLRRELVW